MPVVRSAGHAFSWFRDPNGPVLVCDNCGITVAEGARLPTKRCPGKPEPETAS